MHDTQQDEESCPSQSRRRFLHSAMGIAAAGAASVVARPIPLRAGTQEPQGSLVAPGDCDCSAESGLPLLAAAMVDGTYVGLVSTNTGPALHSLIIDGADVSMGAAVAVQVPGEFQPNVLGVARHRLVVAGGVPFVWRSYTVDDRTEPILDLGVGPSAFFVDSGVAEPIPLPDVSREAFAIAGGVGETSTGALVVMIEHSGGEPESRYAAAVDVFEEVPGGWSVRASARGLGESGPNYLVVDGTAIGVELKTARGTGFIGDGTSAFTASARQPDVLGAEQVVTIVPVAGARGQAIVIGTSSARLVEEVRRVL
jgi:hypothetical protein